MSMKPSNRSPKKDKICSFHGNVPYLSDSSGLAAETLLASVSLPRLSAAFWLMFAFWCHAKNKTQSAV